VLEAFAGMPDHQLTVCGPLASEPQFCAAYNRELTRFPNIRALGWIDITGPEFAALSQQAVAHITPSCAEAQCGAVINCMASGLIPMVSRQVGMDVDPAFGVLMEDDSVAGIRQAVRALAKRSPEQLSGMARRAWEIAHEQHSIASYKAAVGGIVERILESHPRLGVSGFLRLQDAHPEADNVVSQVFQS
jgi:glycosyltransferase involved in cell wall biosynthesis